MKALGFLNPKAGVGQSRLVLNLGWVLADAGFRVGLVDFDPQARLTELAGASGEAVDSVYGVLAPIIEARGSEPAAPDTVELDSTLWLVRGHIQASMLDDAMAVAWTRAADSRSQLLIRGVGLLVQEFIERYELDVVLCDLGSSLGPFRRACALAVDAIIVPLAPRATEDAALRTLASTFHSWRDASPQGHPDPYRTLGFVVVRPSGAMEVGLDRLADSYQRELSGEHLGTIRDFPSLASIARGVHKPEVELTMADGAVGSLSSAVVDLRRQYEALATRLVRATGILDEDVLAERLELALYSELEDELPSALDGLSSHTILGNVSGVDIETVEVHPAGLRIVGSATVSVTLEWGGGETRDGLDMKEYFPLSFDLELDRSHESISVIHRLDVDTSSFYE